VIVISDSSPLITLARYLELLREFSREIAISQDVFEEVTVAGAGLPGAEQIQKASWIRVQPNPSELSAATKAACAGVGIAERSAIHHR